MGIHKIVLVRAAGWLTLGSPGLSPKETVNADVLWFPP